MFGKMKLPHANVVPQFDNNSYGTFFYSIIQGLSRGQEATTLKIFLNSIDPTCPYDMIFCIDYLLMYLRHF